MRKNLVFFNKALVIGILILIVGMSINPSASKIGNINKISKNETMVGERDNILDIVVSNPAGGYFSMLLGNITGEFDFIYDYFLGMQTAGIVSGDFNLDGFLDIAICNLWKYSISVLRGDGNGYFDECIDYDVGEEPIQIITGDYNLDGFLDLAVANTYDSFVSLLLNDGSGNFGENRREDFPVGDRPHDLVAGDFNNDDLLDLVAISFNNDTLSILIGDGNGSFLPYILYPAGDGPFGVDTGDFNNDNFLDLVVVNVYEQYFSIFFNDGSAGFDNRQDFFVGEYPLSILTEDFNNDNALDIALTYGDGFERYVDIFLGDNTGDFQLYNTYEIPSFGWDIIAADFNGDDELDLAITTPDIYSICVFNGDGTGNFSKYKDYYAGLCPIYMAFGDFNTNNPPEQPSITGNTNGKVGTSYTYTFSSIDPDEDNISEYIIDWGDNTSLENITGPFASGEEVQANHIWTSEDTYIIKAKAIDIYGGESEWAVFTVTIPRNKAVTNIHMFLLRLLKRFPLLERLFKMI
jgi:hypothetical protein